jgi:CPA2 family monovalent cation:H+ antiporter-2
VDAHAFLVVLTAVLGVAAVTTVVCQRLKQPVVLGYILAGLILGPSVPIPIFADRQIVQTLSELGVILLMFSLGLEFSLGQLFKLGPTAGITALVQTSLMVWLGFLAGKLVVGVLIVEDLIAILLMATLTAVASGAGLSATEMVAVTSKLVAFLLGLVGIGLLACSLRSFSYRSAS